MDNQIFIVAATRTPIGCMQGQFSKVPATKLGGLVIRELIERTQVDPQDVTCVIMGQVLCGGNGQNPARQASTLGRIPFKVPAHTVDMGGASGLKAIYKGYSAIKSGVAKIVIAGGQENVTLSKHTQYIRDAHIQGANEFEDSYVSDVLRCPYTQTHVALAVETLASEMEINRVRQDQTAYYSNKKASYAINQGFFAEQITSVTNYHFGQVIETDEMPVPKIQISQLANMETLFNVEDGGVTLGNMAGPADGAAAVMLCDGYEVRSSGLLPLATIIACAQVATDPFDNPRVAVDAIGEVLKKAKWHIYEVDLFEVDESFAAHLVMTLEALKLDMNKVNVTGGAIALGYPIGAAGAVALVTLLYNLKRIQKNKGIVVASGGGGVAISIAVEIQSELMPSTSSGIF